MKNIVNRTVGATLRIGLIVAKRIGYPVAPYIPLFVVMLWVRLRMSVVAQEMLGSGVWKVFLESKERARKVIFRGIHEMSKKVAYTNVTFPTERPMIFAMIGLPQTGKSVIATAFADVIGAIVIDSNAIRDYLFRHGLGHFRLLNHLAFCMARNAIECGYNVVLDSDFASPVKRRMLDALAWKMGADVRYIYVQCNKATWWARVRSDTHKFGPIYHNAVASRAAELLPTVSQTYDPKRQLLIDCVIGEYERQEIEHEYIGTCPKDSIRSTSFEGVAKETARGLAYRVLATRGADSSIRAHYQNLLNRYANL